jgi:dihydroorotate dehydrogenase
MKIKRIEFKVNAASGALGWGGEGYWYHKIFAFLFPSFKKVTERMNFVAKTTTWNENEGNLPLNEKYEPRELFPKCIKVYPIQGMMLNAVSLSGPGFKALLSAGKFQNVRRDALGISFMPIGMTIGEMLWETRSFRDKLIEAMYADTYHFHNFQSPIWVQVNQSCPNTIRSDGQILIYMKDILEMLQPLRKTHGILLDLKVNFLVSNEVIAEICKSDLCDIVTISNTIKFGNEDSGIRWKRLFWWRRSSPLAKLGGGGLSGKPLFDAVCNKIMSLRKDGIKIPIKASGGIFSAQDVRVVKAYGANAIEFATVMSLRPWRVEAIVKEAERIF